MNVPERDYQVFNPGIQPQFTITLGFTSLEDVAWVERAILDRKRDGFLSRLMAGILGTALCNVVNIVVRRVSTGEQITPERLHQKRLGISPE